MIQPHSNVEVVNVDQFGLRMCPSFNGNIQATARVSSQANLIISRYIKTYWNKTQTIYIVNFLYLKIDTTNLLFPNVEYCVSKHYK